ncbi:hypothetical protein PSC71_08270 [Devosia sp. J2-20]|uniref:hypothetical protein n=1 Tax=Devosia sp. J2-20 TaxID=3026161 RepID=UPI00249C0A3C|nr:hypothetical protein [Devosia sp. J2-20]WDR00728.1 hypothetical protein PSC71_08270 [Devosia sp. J2-20]
MTLAKYVQAGGVPTPIDSNLALFTQEVAILESIAEAHPIKAAKIAVLVGEWRRYMSAARAKLH